MFYLAAFILHLSASLSLCFMLFVHHTVTNGKSEAQCLSFLERDFYVQRIILKTVCYFDFYS